MPLARKKNTPKAGVRRHNIALTKETRDRGEELARAERRSFSNFLEVLIEKEYAARHPEEATRSE